MRLGLLIRDREYRDALAGRLSSYDNNIFVNIIEKGTDDSSGSLILTDVLPSQVDSKVLEAVKDRIVFITSSRDGIPEEYNSVFKYSSIALMISELSIIYNSWHGSGPGRDHSACMIMVCCETDAYSADRCSSLARQIIYRCGGSVLILPLSYINDYGTEDKSSKGCLSRLLYSIQTGRGRDITGYTFTDSYGVSSLMLPAGANPAAGLDGEELRKLVTGLSGSFDTVIGDAGTCFREENIALMRESDSIVYFGTGRRDTGIEELLGPEAVSKLIRIKFTGGTADAAAIDDCVNRIYRIGNNPH